VKAAAAAEAEVRAAAMHIPERFRGWQALEKAKALAGHLQAQHPAHEPGCCRPSLGALCQEVRVFSQSDVAMAVRGAGQGVDPDVQVLAVARPPRPPSLMRFRRRRRGQSPLHSGVSP
jgi:hypothetical protein